MGPPVLVVAFARPREFDQCLAQLRSVGVKRLYVAIDGARSTSEQAVVNEVRRTLEKYATDFEISLRLGARNSGCHRWVSSSVSWFFEQEKFGIICEEDILLDRRFYEWCGRIAGQYEDNLDIMHVNAFYPCGADLPNQEPHFTKYVTSWGWATWARAWAVYDDRIADVFVDMGFLKSIFYLRRVLASGLAVAIHYALAIRMIRQEKLSSWAYRWAFSVWRAHGIVLSPGVNLSKNIGCGPGATHTINERLDLYDFADASLHLSESHPLLLDSERDRKIFSAVTRSSDLMRLARMFISVLVPNRIFFWLRKISRSM